MESIWENTAKMPHFEQLSGDVSTDVLIIGGGIVGILCAYELEKHSVNCVIAEADRVMSGVSANTTAKITALHGLIYSRLKNEFDYETAEKYYTANTAAIAEYAHLSENYEFNFELQPSYVYSMNNPQKIENELSAISRIGARPVEMKNPPLPFSTAGAVGLKNQAQMNPKKLVSLLCRTMKIYEKTRVNELDGTVGLTDKGRIFAKNVIVATHFPFMNKYGFYPLKLYQSRSYVLALKNAVHSHGMYVDEAENGLSFRGYGNYLLLGGGDHRTGEKGGNYRVLKKFAYKNYPDSEIDYEFSTQDCMTLDGIPYIGRYSRGLDNVYVATGFNKWGMTSAMVSAKILCDLICGADNDYADIFSPSRSILRKQLFVNAGKAFINLIAPTKPRCPHMGCALKWNETEHSWDCPCHGSRFNENGKLLNEPSTDSIDLK